MKIYKMSQHRAYHGTNSSFEAFDIGFSGNGIDQEGPGIYFSSSIEDASGYGGNLREVELNFKNAISLEKHANENDVRKMLLWSAGLNEESELYDMNENDFYESRLSDWGEHPYSAFESAVQSILTYSESEHDSFLSVWYDHYRNNPVEYLKNMVKLGYDGVIVPKDGVVHYIVFDTSIISVLR